MRDSLEHLWAQSAILRLPDRLKFSFRDLDCEGRHLISVNGSYGTSQCDSAFDAAHVLSFQGIKTVAFSIARASSKYAP